MKKNWSVFLSIFMTLVVIATSFLATSVMKKIREKEVIIEEKHVLAKKTIYGVDGKPGGGQLETKPKLITKDHVYFEDRILERFQYDAEEIVKESDVLNEVMTLIPEDVNKYLMLIPIRISFEDSEIKQYSNDAITAITEMYAKMPQDVVTIDVAATLYKHKNDYLFFRTDDVWTALGAYFGAQEFSRSIGIDMIGIEAYRKYRLEGYIGIMRELSGAESLNKYPDYVDYYILDSATNEQTITSFQNNEYLTYNSPAVAVSRRGTDIFIGPYFSHSILHGDACNGKNLMILGDEYSKSFAPWLTPYYENICLVNPSFFDGGSKEFWQLFSKYKITDFLIIEHVQKMGDSMINSKIRELISGLW